MSKPSSRDSNTSRSPIFFPRMRKITAPATDFLWQILEQKTVPFNLEDQGCKDCYSNRLVMHTEAIDMDGRETFCFLPTKLHEK